MTATPVLDTHLLYLEVLDTHLLYLEVGDWEPLRAARRPVRALHLRDKRACGWGGRGSSFYLLHAEAPPFKQAPPRPTLPPCAGAMTVAAPSLTT